MLSAQITHLLSIRNVGAESLRLSKAEQIFTSASQIHQANSPTSTHCVIEIEGTCIYERSCIPAIRIDDKLMRHDLFIFAAIGIDTR